MNAPLKKEKLGLTKQELEFIDRIKVDDAYAFKEILRVEHRDIPSAVVPLDLNSGQTMIEASVKRMLALNLRMQDEAWKQGQPTYIPAEKIKAHVEKGTPIADHEIGLRLLIGKSRRGGFSTWTLAKGVKRIATTPNYSALLMAHQVASATEIWRIAKRFYDHWPQHWINVRPHTKANNDERLEFEETESRYAISTAGRNPEAEANRGWKFDLYHFSEYAHYKSYADVAQCMSAALQYAWVIKESTANGRTGPFYEEWQKALTIDEAERAYDNRDIETLQSWGTPGQYKFFFSWLDDPGLVLPVFDWEREELERTLDEYERALMQRFPEKFTLGKVKWRREKIRHDCQDHPILSPTQLFQQEFPATEEEMFQATGSPVFDQIRIDEYAISIPAIITQARLHGRHAPEEVLPGAANFWAYKPPQKGHAYTIGADVGKGVEQDYSVAVVLDRGDGTSLEEVALFRSNVIHQKDFGHVLTMLAELYNGAFLCPEINDGLAVATTIVNDNRYTRIYQPKALDTVKYDPESANAFRFGFNTQGPNKGHVVQITRNAFRDGLLVVRSKSVLDELRIFQVDPEKKKYGAPKGEHDDCVIALCLAYFASFHAPSIDLVVARAGDPSPEGFDARQNSIAAALMRKKEKSRKHNSKNRNHRPGLKPAVAR